MKAIYLITGTAFLLAIGTALVETSNTCCGADCCTPTCCVGKKDSCVRSCCK